MFVAFNLRLRSSKIASSDGEGEGLRTIEEATAEGVPATTVGTTFASDVLSGAVVFGLVANVVTSCSNMGCGWAGERGTRVCDASGTFSLPPSNNGMSETTAELSVFEGSGVAEAFLERKNENPHAAIGLGPVTGE